jgi:hypothetical protein
LSPSTRRWKPKHLALQPYHIREVPGIIRSKHHVPVLIRLSLSGDGKSRGNGGARKGAGRKLSTLHKHILF